MTTPPRLLSRRRALGQLSTGVVAAAAALGARRVFAADPGRPQLAKVLVSPERVQRTIVGLRPFRPSGFVVRAEQIGSQTVVHHYGHGGCGVTLSWGTAALAAEEVLKTGAKRVAVLGAGVIGLTTARVLQQHGLVATIYARELPPHTCSDVAGARWYPFDVFDEAVATPAFIDLLWRTSRVAYDAFRKLPAAEYGIHTYPTYACRDTPFSKTTLLALDSPIRDLLPGLRDLAPGEHPFGFRFVRAFETLFIEPGVFLPALIRDHAQAGGTIVVRDFASLQDVAALEERVVVNCTGLGAAALFGDKEMYPIKGQLTILKPQPEIDYITLPPDGYMFPRSDGIVLGGTFQAHVKTLTPDRVAEKRILASHARFFARL